MRILLAGPDFEENLSIRYLASSLQAEGHEALLAVFNSAADLEAVAEQAAETEIVGLSVCFQSRAQEFLALARRIKELHPEKLIVAGGHYASCAAQALLENHPELDIIVIHEGEQTLVEIVRAAANLKDCLPSITGVAYREDGQVRFTPQRRTLDDLDILPFPERRGADPRHRWSAHQLSDGEPRMLRELRILLHHNPAPSGTGQTVSPTQRGIDRRRDGRALSRARNAAVRIPRRQFSGAVRTA